MALSLKNADVEQMARELARRQGCSPTEAVQRALAAELVREQRRVRPAGVAERLLAIGDRFTALPVLDHRTDDEILGYDSDGVPGSTMPG